MKNSSVIIRTATEEDASELLKIYAPYVEKTVITFEYDVPSGEAFRDRIRGTLKSYPYLVAIRDGEAVGYAYASPFKERAAYDWSAETTIYIREDCRGLGIGSALYEELERCLAEQHVHNLCACIAYPHPESENFHKKMGYETVAHFHRSGYKLGRWVDMIWMEKTLCPHGGAPEEFVPFERLAQKTAQGG